MEKEVYLNRYEGIQDERMIQRLELIECLVKKNVSPIGFMTFAFGKGFQDQEIEAFGKAYMDILKKHDAYGEGVRTHYERINYPCTDRNLFYKRALDGITGERYFQNRFYGVVRVSFSLWEKEIAYDALEALRAFILENNGNMRIILSDVPEMVLKEIKKWEELNVQVLVSETEDIIKENVQAHFENKNVAEDVIRSIVNTVRVFPEEERETVLPSLVQIVCDSGHSSALSDDVDKMEEVRIGFGN